MHAWPRRYTMATTGCCGSKPLLDLDMKVAERRALLEPWANGCRPSDRWQPVEMEELRMAPLTEPEPDHRGKRPAMQSNGSITKEFQEDPPRSVDAPVLLYHQRLQALHSLQTLVPSLLQHELEMALEKLGLKWDRLYAWDMFMEMMRSQAQYCFPNPDLTDETRTILVDWIIQVHGMMAFQEETLYLAIHLLNCSLREIKVSRANLQLLAMVCLFLACKKEEQLLPEVSGLCYLMDHAYTKHQLLRMERKVLCGLKFKLSYCAPLNFLFLLATIARCSATVVWMARYLLQLSLLESQCLAFPPVQLAGAALSLARRTLQEPPTPEGEAAWCLASSIHVGSEAALLKIMGILANAAAVAHAQGTCATYIKFSSPETMHVSMHPGLTTVSNLLGGFT